MTMKINIKILTAVIGGIILLALIAAGFFTYSSQFGAPQFKAEDERFVVPLNAETMNTIQKLHDQGFIKSEWAFNYALKGTKITPGGYKVSKA